MGGLGCQRIMVTQAAKTKLHNLQAPQSRRTIPNSQPFESQTVLQRDRPVIPKKRRMETVTDEELTMIKNRLNHRPRKRLRFKTPHEAFTDG